MSRAIVSRRAGNQPPAQVFIIYKKPKRDTGVKQVILSFHWFSVFEGKLTDEDIFNLVTKLKQQKLEASHKHFKDQALPIKSKYITESEERTRAYLQPYIRASTTGES